VIEAEKLGLLSKVVKGGKDEVVKEALELAKLIASKSPVAVATSKHLISHSRDHTVAENLSYTSVWNSAALMTKVAFFFFFLVSLAHLHLQDITEATSRNTVPKFAPLGFQSKLSKL